MSEHPKGESLTNQFDASAKRIEIGLFVPKSEDGSNRLMNILAHELMGNTPFNLRLFLVRQPQDKRVQERPSLRKKFFLHSQLLKSVVFPFIEKGAELDPDDTLANPQNILLSPRLLERNYPDRIYTEDVPDPNDPDFIKHRITGNEQLELAFSARNLKIFGGEIINAFNKKGPGRFINIHPGPLPDVAGLEAPFWTRYLIAQDKLQPSELCTSMHVLIRKIDAGNIIDYATKPLNGSASQAIANYPHNAAPQVAGMILKYINTILTRRGTNAGIRFTGVNDVNYYTLPLEEEIKKANDQYGIKFFDPSEQISYITKNYSNESLKPDHFHALNNTLWEAWHEFIRHPANAEPLASPGTGGHIKSDRRKPTGMSPRAPEDYQITG